MCTDPLILKSIFLIKTVVRAITIVVPIILVVTVMIRLVKTVSNGSDDIPNAVKAVKSKLISAIVVFFVPTVVTLFMSTLNSTTDYESCWINSDNVSYYAESAVSGFISNPGDYTANDVSKYQNYLMYIDDESTRENYSATLKQMKKNASNNNSSGSSGGSSSNPTRPNNNSEYASSNSYTNSVNGIKYMLYNQDDSRWGNTAYDDTNISAEGCLMTSVAVVSSAYDSTITPITVLNRNYHHHFPYDSVPGMTDNAFSCKVLPLSSYTDEAKRTAMTNELKKGNVLVFRVQGKNYGRNNTIVNGQHYMAALDYNENTSKIYIGNAFGTSGYATYGWHDMKTVLTSVESSDLTVCVPSQQLINKFK